MTHDDVEKRRGIDKQQDAAARKEYNEKNDRPRKIRKNGLFNEMLWWFQFKQTREGKYAR
jgi:hypothetical protein